MISKKSFAMMGEAICRAVYKNNEGAKLVRNSQYDEAVKSFTVVLKILKPIAAFVERRNDAETIHRHHHNLKKERSRNVLLISFENNSYNINGKENDGEDETKRRMRRNENVTTAGHEFGSSSIPTDDIFVKQHRKLMTLQNNDSFNARQSAHYVFRDPVMIPPDSVPTIPSINEEISSMVIEEVFSRMYPPDFFSKFLMIVMFNLALTLHLHAQSLLMMLSCNQQSSSDITNYAYDNTNDTECARKMFMRSRKLYELAFEMHLDEERDKNDNSNGGMNNADLLFTLALINNLGLVYHMLNDCVRSQTCFNNMFSTMMYLLDTGNESNSIKEWDGLLSNVMDLLLKNKYEVTAPAA